MQEHLAFGHISNWTLFPAETNVVYLLTQILSNNDVEIIVLDNSRTRKKTKKKENKDDKKQKQQQTKT